MFKGIGIVRTALILLKVRTFNEYLIKICRLLSQSRSIF